MKTIGILGGGQLAQLLAYTAYPVGLKTLCFSSEKNCPASRLSSVFIGDLNHVSDLENFAAHVDVITVENENIAPETLKTLAKFKPVYPNLNAIAMAQDRLLEKNYFQKYHIETPRFMPVNTIDDFENAVKNFGKNGILKTRRLGYDGKGQVRITEKTNLAAAWNAISTPAIFESFISFSKEVSILAARNTMGDIVTFPLIENQHAEGILRTSQFLRDDQLENQAKAIVKTVLNSLDYVGLLAIEFFVQNKQLIANEIAPRVHNSGHLTIEGCQISQFEQHLRAITGEPLIAPRIMQAVLMTNIIGQWPDDLSNYQHVYDYGKIPRINRKLGHIITIL